MKKDLSVFDKARLFLEWARNQKGFGLIASCDLCRSTKIKREKHFTERISPTEVKYKATYSCQNCGGEAEAVEVWRDKL